jgi:hypothetical protein
MEADTIGLKDIPETPCISVQPASVFLLLKVTVVTFLTVLFFPSSFAQRKIASSSRPSPTTRRKSIGEVYGISGGISSLSFSRIFVAAVPLDQSIGSTTTAPLVII